MSVELTLNLNDYKKILGWFELAFAKTNEVPAQDSNTFRKVSVMAQVTMEEIEENKDDHRRPN
tara:strand:- start:2382 stop:2570 length:189 start_codon:yes stop_codon:yes gene_type:complete